MSIRYTNLPPNHENFRLGPIRDSYHFNDLIINQNPRLGQPVRRGFELPKSKTFVYGKKNFFVDGGVAKAMVHDDNILKVKKSKMEPAMARDFIALNKAGVQSGITTVKDQKQYRMRHDIRVKDEPVSYFGKPLVLPPDYTCGHSNRPSTPVKELLKFKFQEKWIDDKLKAQDAFTKFESQQTHLKTGQAFENRSSVLRKNLIPKEYHFPTGLKKQGTEYWKMQKFNKSGPKVSTFRTNGQYKRAFEIFREHEKCL